ncbi:hypothetical protein E3Q24_01275 [Wallemia mellicola]|nr:hypothetical protein E3Q24_01275 [Wallemia mellicola]TIC75393.1 release factor [Wallemia mellicola]
MITKLFARRFATAVGINREAKILRLADKFVNERKSLIENSAELDSKTLAIRSRRLKELDTLPDLYNAYKNSVETLDSTKTMATTEQDPTLREMAAMEIESCQKSQEDALNELVNGLLRSNTPAEITPKGLILELKAGVGGSESGLFVQDMLKMYKAYSETRGWKSEVIATIMANESSGGAGAVKEALVEIKGPNVWSTLKYEKGVHRVQRVPLTETQGRVHTSTIGILVMPLAENNQRKVYDEKDVRVEVMRARGAGGQHVNKTESAVRLTHIPTGIQVSMQDTRSQQQNRTKAYEVLASRLLERQIREEVEERKTSRKSQIGNMDRSDKIRTYNFPQDRITDHRVGVGLNDIQSFFENGEGLDWIIDSLKEREKELLLDGLLQDA